MIFTLGIIDAVAVCPSDISFFLYLLKPLNQLTVNCSLADAVYPYYSAILVIYVTGSIFTQNCDQTDPKDA